MNSGRLVVTLACSALFFACHHEGGASEDRSAARVDGGDASSTSAFAQAPAGGGSAAAADPALDAFFATKDAKLTPELEDKLLSRIEECSLTDEPSLLAATGHASLAPMADQFIAANCPPFKAWQRAMNEHFRADKDGSKAVDAKRLTDRSPAVRCVAAQGLSAISLAQQDPAATKPFLEVADKEAAPEVLACFISAWLFSPPVHQVPEAKPLLVKWASHPDELVRRSALRWLVSTFSAKYPDTFDTVLERLDHEPSMALRAQICEGLGGSDNPRAIPAFAKYLTAAAPDALYDGCFSGAVDAWANEERAKPSREAYELSMKVLEATPRTKSRPPGEGLGMSGLASASPSPEGAWTKPAPPWFHRERLLKALESVAADRNAGDDARFSAVYDLKALHAPNATFTRLSKVCAAAETACDPTTKMKLESILAGK